MMINAMGLILADNRRVSLGALSEPRALSAVPFAGRFRIIDFVLSNLVNSGVKRVGVVALSRYKSLMDHLGTGSWWDLDRMTQGLYLLPPYINPVTRSAERSDLTSVIDYLNAGKQDYVFISDSNFVMNTRLNKLLDAHMESGADITLMYNRDGVEFGPPSISIVMDENNRIREAYVDLKETDIEATAIGVMVIAKDLLLTLLEDARSRGITEFNFLGLVSLFEQLDVRGFEYKGLIFRINSIATYFQASMTLFDDDVRRQLFSTKTPIYTKVKNLAPCVVEPGSRVKNVLASDGCVIQGDVENCILFRGALVGKGAKIRNSVIFQDVQISSDVSLDHVIIDKDSVVKMGVRLVGHPGFPTVIGKGSIV